MKTDFRGFRDTAQSVAIQADGKIVVGGYSETNGNVRNFALSRYHANGIIDISFGTDGKVITVLRTNSGTNEAVVSVIIQPDGKIVAGGYSLFNSPTVRATVVRYNPDGTLDATFGNNGIAVTNADQVTTRAASMARQPDGKLVLAGNGVVNNELDFVVLRFNSNGTVDTDFSGGGTVTTDFAFEDTARAVEIDQNGKIIVTGVSYLTSSGTGDRIIAVARYNSDGSSDTTFGTGGKVSIAADPNYRFNEAFSLAIQPDTKILVGGATGTSRSGILRLNANGSRDTSFGINGIATVTLPPIITSHYPTSIKFDSQGRILSTGPSNSVFAVFRYNSNGVQDHSFGINGVAMTDLGNSGELGYSIAVQSDDKIVLVGESRESVSGSYPDFTILRYFGNACAVTLRRPFDFDGDGKSDVGIFRPSVGQWWINRSANNVTVAAEFGTLSDKIAPGDFTGDGKADLAFWRPSNGFWYVLRSEDNSFYGFPFGTTGDQPTPGDFDGDGKTDAAVYRQSNNGWYQQRSTQGFTAITFGTNGDVPVHSAFLP